MGYTYNDVEVKTLGEFLGRGKGQDYESIKKSLRRGQVWKDPDFSQENAETLGKKIRKDLIFWSRAKEVTPDPVFVKDQSCFESKCSRFDIIQGALSDCWLLVGIDVIAEQPSLLRMVVPEDNSFENDNSVFHFRFWRCGYWVDVVVDDQLPCLLAEEHGQIITKLAFARNRENEFWVPLLEKAYAKLYASYSMLQFGLIGDSLVDLTGGIGSLLTLRSPTSLPPKEIVNLMVESYERGSLIGLGICIGTGASGSEVGAGEVKMPNGLAKGHAYSVTGLGQVPYEGKSVLLVRVRNPWGTDFEWNGAWSDGSPEWKAFNEDKILKLHLKKDDGEFWMTFRDVQKNFDLLNLCYLPAYTMKDVLPTSVTPTMWKNHEFHGIWPGAGSENIVELCKNPQYLLDLTVDSAETKNNEMEVLVSVFNKMIRLTGKDNLPQKFFPVIFTVISQVKQAGGVITRRFVPADIEARRLVQTVSATPSDMRESFEFHRLAKERYVIIPVFGTIGGVKGEYLLRVYTDGPSKMIKLD